MAKGCEERICRCGYSVVCTWMAEAWSPFPVIIRAVKKQEEEEIPDQICPNCKEPINMQNTVLV
ncbi:MAG: hypothetical protein KJI69_01015 [Patescibacteria group bacterium]|nr:hypothetical protein [Patescibacteria group bacterium]